MPEYNNAALREASSHSNTVQGQSYRQQSEAGDEETRSSLLRHSQTRCCCWLCRCSWFSRSQRQIFPVTAVSSTLTVFTTPVGIRARKQHISFPASSMQQFSDRSHSTDVTRLLRNIQLSPDELEVLWQGCSASLLVTSGDTTQPPALHGNSLVTGVAPAKQVKSKLGTEHVTLPVYTAH